MPGQYRFSAVTCPLVVIALLGLSGCREETRTAALAPPEVIVQTVAGQVIKQTFGPGQKVKEGEPLFSIDPRAYEETVIDAQAKLAEAEAGLEKARLDRSYADVRSPIAGQIGLQKVEVGALATAGQTLLATVSTLHPVVAHFSIPELDYLNFARRFLASKREDKAPIELILAGPATLGRT